MRRPVNSAALRRAADAVDRRDAELDKLGESDESVRVAEDGARAARNDRELQALRVDIADREVEHHLDGAVPPPAGVGGGNGRRPPSVPAASVVDADPPESDRSWWVFPNTVTAWVAALALVALIVAVVALFFPKGHILALDDIKKEIQTALAPVAKNASDAKTAADKAVKLGEDNGKAIGALGARMDTAEAKLACDPCKKAEKPAAKPKADAKPAKKPAAAAPVVPKAEAKVAKKDCEECREAINVKREEPRTDGKCVTVLNTGNRIQIGKDGKSDRLVARLVDDNVRQVAGSPVVYIGNETVSGNCHADEKKLIVHWNSVRSNLQLPTFCKPNMMM